MHVDARPAIHSSQLLRSHELLMDLCIGRSSTQACLEALQHVQPVEVVIATVTVTMYVYSPQDNTPSGVSGLSALLGHDLDMTMSMLVETASLATG